MQLQDLNTVLGVELKIIDDQLLSCRYSLVVQKKHTLTITQSKIVEGNLSAILEVLPKMYPIALTLTGKGIINKNVQLIEGMDMGQLFQNSFPSVEQQDFYVQQVEQGQHALISIIRKQVANDLLVKMQRAGLKIFILALGAIVTAPIWSQLNMYDSEIIFDGHFVKLNAANEFTTYRYEPALKNKFPIQIAQEVIQEENIIAYASAFQLLLHEQLTVIKSNATEINNGFTGFIENGKLKKKAMLFLFALFAALMVSFITFSTYNQKNEELMQTVGAQTTNAEQTRLMNKNIGDSEALLKQLNWNGGYNYGLLLNEIGGSMPKQLRLLSIAMNDFKSEEEKLTRIPNIKIIGTTANLTAVNNWIFVLKEKKWIKSVQLLKYQEMIDASDYQFDIQIKY